MVITHETIKKARLGLKETQSRFAERFGVDQSTVQRWETTGPPDRGPARMALEHVLAEIALAPRRKAS